MLTAGCLILAVGFTSASAADRAHLPREEQEKLLRRASNEELLSGGRASVAALGTYQVLLAKRERIAGKLQELQLRRLTVREHPFAVRVVAEAGGTVGRKILFDQERDPTHLLVREPGVLGWLGWIQIPANDPRIFKSTNHPVTDVGFGAMLRQEAQDLEQGKPFGGYLRTDEGWNERGRYCIRFDAPPGAGRVYASRCRVCLDAASWLPLEMTVWDEDGLLETYEFSELLPNVPGGAAALAP
ncbi:MAG TPA: DUF1571 domain-containing protein, partial [Myxococcales bacterium]|nr:DUF1571 domain-containing protein [Myxococcales bacterium]